MPKKTIEVDITKLQSAIQQAEISETFSNRTALYEKVAEIYNDPKVTPSVVYLRIKSFNLSVSTPMGQKGKRGSMTEEHKAKFLASRSGLVRKSRGEKFASNEQIKNSFVALRKRTPVNLHVLVNKVEKGSIKAAIKLQCIQCMGYENYHTGIRDCTSPACSLYAFRPYQVGVVDEEADATVDQQETQHDL